MEEDSSLEDSDWLDSLDMGQRVWRECDDGIRKADAYHAGDSFDDSEEDEEDESSELSEPESLDGGSAELELVKL